MLEFWKMHGSGNDFILIDNRNSQVDDNDVGRIVERVCRRRESVGADGVILVVNSEKSDFGWRFLNADGGEVEMCGNGARCVARFAYLKGIAGRNMVFETLRGPVTAEVRGRLVKVLMPQPTGLRLDVDLPHQEGWKTADVINTGVPHVVVGVDTLSGFPVFEQGRAIRYHPLFQPAGTNANFVRQIDRDTLEVRTYERGVEDETFACGTGAIASALVASVRGLVSSPVTVRTRGGEALTIYFEGEREVFNRVWLEGNTSIVCTSQLHEEAL